MVKLVVDRSGMRCCVLMRCEAKVRSSEQALDPSEPPHTECHARIRCWGIHETFLISFCEAQGKGRAKGRPRKVTERSFIDMDGGWWLSFP